MLWNQDVADFDVFLCNTCRIADDSLVVRMQFLFRLVLCFFAVSYCFGERCNASL